MTRNSIYLFTIFGIPVRLHVSWLIIFFLITWSLAAGWFPMQYKNWPHYLYWVIGGVTSLLFFVSVLLHELSHSVVAKSQGMRVKDIVLFIFGGVSEISDEPESAGREFLMAFVGPLTSFAVGLISLGIWFLVRNVNEPARAMTAHLFSINIMLGVFNLVPGFPLDGGRVLRSIIWGITGDLKKATRWATRMGSVVAYGLIFLGIVMIFHGQLIGGIWLAFIGWFLNNAAQASFSSAMVKNMLMGHRVRELTNRNVPRVSAEASIEQAVHDYFLAEGRRCVPVVQDGTVIGLLTMHNVKKAPRESWPQTRADQIMVPMDQVRATHPDTDLWKALQEMTEEGVNQLAVIEDDRMLGLLGRDAVLSFLRMQAELEE